jgi:hypothetical protein
MGPLENSVQAEGPGMLVTPSGSVGNELTNKSGSVSSAHSELGNEISCAHDLVDRLIDKLTPVLNTQKAEEIKSDSKAMPVYATPLAQQVQSHTNAVAQLNEKLSLVDKILDI